MNLNKLTADDWRALAAVPEGACTLEAFDESRRLRLVDAGIIRTWGTITDRGQGVIAAARVLMPRFFEWSHGLAAVRVEPTGPAGDRAILWQDQPKSVHCGQCIGGRVNDADDTCIACGWVRP